MPELAVLMSVYGKDKPEFVTQSIESILGQTFSLFTFFIFLDGPLLPGVETYINSIDDKRLRIFRSEENGGLAKALNKLLAEVLADKQYRLIARMDSDDISDPLRFEKQCRFLKENPKIDCIGSWFEEIDDNGRHLIFRQLPVDHQALIKRYAFKTPFAHSSVIYRRELIEKAGFYPIDTILMEDNVLWGRSINAGLQFANLPEYLLKFRVGKEFYNRRSGFIYGFSFIKCRCKLSRELKMPLRFCMSSVLVGMVKMMPPFIIRFFHDWLLY